MAAKKRILLAFTGLPLAGEIFKVAGLFARDSAAEAVDHPHCTAATPGFAVDVYTLKDEWG